MEHPYYLRLRTTKAIPAGEELLLDYGDTYWHDWKPPRARDSSGSHSGNDTDDSPAAKRRKRATHVCLGSAMRNQCVCTAIVC